jgi:hypothetical protein
MEMLEDTYEQDYKSLMALLDGKDFRLIENGDLPLVVERVSDDIVSLGQLRRHQYGALAKAPEVHFLILGKQAMPVYMKDELDQGGVEFATVYGRYEGVPVRAWMQPSLDAFVAEWKELHADRTPMTQVPKRQDESITVMPERNEPMSETIQGVSETPEAPRSWKVGVRRDANHEWSYNPARFGTEAEAEKYRDGLPIAWPGEREQAVFPSADEPTGHTAKEVLAQMSNIRAKIFELIGGLKASRNIEAMQNERSEAATKEQGQEQQGMKVAEEPVRSAKVREEAESVAPAAKEPHAKTAKARPESPVAGSDSGTDQEAKKTTERVKTSEEDKGQHQDGPAVLPPDRNTRSDETEPAQRVSGKEEDRGVEQDEKKLRMTLSEAAKQAVENNDVQLLGKVVEQLRMKRGLNYEQCMKYVRTHTGIEADKYEAMLYEADTQEATEAPAGVEQEAVKGPTNTREPNRDRASTNQKEDQTMAEKVEVTQNVEQETEKKGKRVATLTSNGVRGSVWVNPSERGERISASIAGFYRRKNPDTGEMETKNTHSYDEEGLDDLIEVAQGAKKVIQEEKQKRGLEAQTENQRVRISRSR